MGPSGSALERIRGDLFGGFTAGVVALPLALAFGVASGAGPAAGLYGAIVLGMVAALFGGTRMQISGPTGPMTVVFASALTVLGGDLAVAMAAVMVAGLLQIAFGAAKLGGLVRFIPYPVVSGFMSGIGAIIILLQLAPLLGASPQSAPVAALAALPSVLASVNAQAALLAALTLLIVFLTPVPVRRTVPAPLIALLVLTPLSVWLGLDVPVIGEIPLGLPELMLPEFSLGTWTKVLVLGGTLAVLASIDTLLTSLVADSITRTRHNSNRELIGQGLGNLMCSFVGGLPGAGATMRTVLNIKAGGRGRLSGATHALFLLALLLGAAPLATQIPLAVLAGILIKVGVDILDYRLLKLVRTAPRIDIAIMAMVFGLTVFVDLIVAVAVGVVLSMAMIIRQLSQQARFHIWPVEQGEGGSIEDGVRVLQIDGPFFFGSASRLLDRVDKVIGTRAVVFDCTRVPFMDLSAHFALEEMVEHLRALAIPSFIVVQPQLRTQLTRLAAPNLPPTMFYEDLVTALAAARATVAQSTRASPLAI